MYVHSSLGALVLMSKNLYEHLYFDYRGYKALAGDIRAMHIRKTIAVEKFSAAHQVSFHVYSKENYLNSPSLEYVCSTKRKS